MWLVDSNSVLSEILDGEAVIIDLSSGRYHAAAGVAATIWEGVLCGHSLARIMDDVRRAHSGVPNDAEAAVRAFIDSVVVQGLAQPSAGDTSTSDPRNPMSGPITPWSEPVLESHDDLADLLLIDPVHDVTTQGWPHTAAPES